MSQLLDLLQPKYDQFILEKWIIQRKLSEKVPHKNGTDNILPPATTITSTNIFTIFFLSSSSGLIYSSPVMFLSPVERVAHLQKQNTAHGWT